MTQVPEEVLATPETVRRALEDGGRAQVTVRSIKTGAHVKLVLACKAKKAEGRGYVPRTSAAGRVGWTAADKIDVTDPDLDWPESKGGAFVKKSMRFYAEDGADRARVWTADSVIKYALGLPEKITEQAEVFLATRCSHCGKKLTDPVSIERGVGPECYGRSTGSRLAARREALPTGPDAPGNAEETRLAAEQATAPETTGLAATLEAAKALDATRPDPPLHVQIRWAASGGDPEVEQYLRDQREMELT